ncbi:hypothetical protein GTQ99_14010 [Kineococcus sp. T13]|uniref:hypothetical protein n=1 Tax=Kineococcus vitellinus TaxID=2696565 RepID=UPI001412512C|nr:hypothetical protein [Kineococcus vitellinus]NAZ76521.1 hypothetical protein [Kineococcus vitellinus]
MRQRWVPSIVPDEAGVPVHRPLLLSRARGIRAVLTQVRVHADTEGLMLHLHLSADGVHAEAAKRWVFDEPRRLADPDGGGSSGAQPVLHVQFDDFADRVPVKDRSVRTFEDTATGEVRFSWEATYWIRQLPTDGRVHLRTSWPQAGLPAAEHTLVLAPPADEGR